MKTKKMILTIEKIIINLMREDKTKFCTIEDIHELSYFIYLQLIHMDKISNYNIQFYVDEDSIKQAVIYNSRIFELDSDECNVYLRSNIDCEDFEYNIDNQINSLIKKFRTHNS